MKEPVLESTPVFDGSTLAEKCQKPKKLRACFRVDSIIDGLTLIGKYRIVKSYMPDLESTLAIEGSTLIGKTETYFLFCAD